MAPKKKAMVDPLKLMGGLNSESTSIDASQSQDRHVAELQKAGERNRHKACSQSLYIMLCTTSADIRKDAASSGSTEERDPCQSRCTADQTKA